jgi:hypothetical protein
LENCPARVRNCEKQKFVTDAKAAISFFITLGSFLAEFRFPTASKSQHITGEGTDYEGNLKCCGTLSEGEKAQ